MNEIVNEFLLAWDKFIPEMQLKQPGFTYTAFGPFTKNKERIQKYGDFKDIARRTASNKILRDKAFNIAKSPKYGG